MTAEDYAKLPYALIMRQDDEGDWIVKVQELDGCMTHGATRIEALEFLDEAIIGYIKSIMENNGVVPMPDKAWWE